MKTLNDEIKSANRNFMETFGRADAEGMGKLYTSDGQLLPSNSDFITGTEGIQTFWQAVMDMGIKTAKLETVELEGHGDTAIEVGQYTLLICPNGYRKKFRELQLVSYTLKNGRVICPAVSGRLLAIRGPASGPHRSGRVSFARQCGCER